MEEELNVTATPEPTATPVPTATPIPDYTEYFESIEDYVRTVEQRTERLPEVVEYTKYMTGIFIILLVGFLMYFAHKFLRMFF